MEEYSFTGQVNNRTTISANTSWDQFVSWNMTNDTIVNQEPFEMGIFKFLIPVLYFVIFITGIIGNSLVLIVLHKYSEMKTVPNIFIINLSIADILFMLTLPFLAYNHYHSGLWMFGDVICVIVVGFDAINQYTGIFLITAMAFDRFVAIAYPIKTMGLRTVRNTRIVCGLVWLISILFSLPLWMYTKTSTYEENTFCSTNLPSFFPIYSFVVGFGIPLVVIGGCYTVVLKIILCSRRPMNTSSKSKKDDTSTRVTLLVLCIFITFIVCWLPFYLLSQFIRPGKEADSQYRHSVAFVIAVTLSYANSCLNPLVYTFVGKNFREHIYSLLCFGKVSPGQQRRRRLTRRSVSSTSYKRSNPRSMSTFSENYTSTCSVKSHMDYPYNKIVGNSRHLPYYNGKEDIDEV